jgi:diguanylate cyclase (GGDEF)-like protein
MDKSYMNLRQMLAGELPLERVGPHLRHSCRKALLSGQRDLMLLTAKVVIEELARRGELLGVAIRGGNEAAEGGPFCVVKGTHRLLDLAVFGADQPRIPSGSSGDPTKTQPPERAIKRMLESDFNQEEFFRTLWYMEHAQKMELGSVRPDEKGAVLLDILELFELFPPQFALFVQLHGNDPLPENQSRLFHMDAEDAANEWAKLRAPGHSVWLPDSKELPYHIRSHQPGVDAVYSADMDPPFQMAVGVPLFEPDEDPDAKATTEIGLLFLVVRKDMERDQLLRLAGRVSRFVTRSWRKLNEVNHRIHIDPLTGVYNKGFYFEQFPIEIERARRSGTPLTYVFADLDHFRKFNTDYGHQNGDRVLRTAAQRLQEELRRVDLVCRYGGEEFVLLLPDTSQESAQEVISRLLDTEFSATVVMDDVSEEIAVTFSYGAISFPHGAADGEELARKANKLMYLSKEHGRNRCHFWSNDRNHILMLPTRAGD